MGDRITEIARSYKGHALQWLLPVIVVLVGLSAFGLGRLSVMGEAGPRLIITLPDGTTQSAAAYAASAAPTTKEPAKTGEYMASKSGAKFYPVGCSGANRIKGENRVYFATPAEAEAAGYEPAANC